MPLLARNIRHPEAWADAEEQWAGEDFPFAALAELADGRKTLKGGLSFYAVKSKDDPILPRIAAALFMSGEQNNAKKAQFRFVSTEQLDELDVAYAVTLGALKDTKLNSFHYDIRGLNGAKAVELARALCAEEPRIVKQQEIVVEVAKGLRLKRYKVDDLKDAGLSLLKRSGALRFSEKSITVK